MVLFLFKFKFKERNENLHPLGRFDPDMTKPKMSQVKIIWS